ncbi:uncharacterized protein E0L32_012357 [Thyridium curvatum]|uniref:Actin interacting protein 3 C-terminal domain-containing protein n=1 Tax=Thyridium curvatum TaxID=1093900 RepID=A0A507B145_9PEZI|nr:uncharacterized protein E0L32_012357 [Thyridium curvatum]TPX16805.1 hypothetical protein E0L32_012357 [Thyridium curvatum]
MQAPGPSRSMQRRSPGAEPGPPPHIPARSMSPAVGMAGPVQSRSSTASNRSAGSSGGGSSRRANASSGSGSNMPLSQIEKSVTHLLVATKQLLETLTQWSRGQATDTQVSDVYVRLGYEFNMACRAFTAINVDTSDLGNVPELLRNILEATLSQEASVESLEKYLPRIRDIIINLLHGLKRKQQKLRQKQSRERENGIPSEASVGRTTSTSTVGSGNSGLTSLLNEGLENGYRPETQREEPASRLNSSPSRRFAAQRDQSQASITSEQSTLSSSTMQNIPVLPPYPSDEPSIASGPPANDLSIDSFPPPPPPPKSSQSALAALQRGGELERRASRRYSQYQISKHLGSGANGVPILPPQNTPIPNRGRGEVRESMRAVQIRDNLKHNRNESSQSLAGGADSSPVRAPSRVSEEKEAVTSDVIDSPTAQTPDDKYPQPSATLNGPPPDVLPMVGDFGEINGTPVKSSETKSVVPLVEPTPTKSHPVDSEPGAAPSTKELTLFLQYKSKVKKFVLAEGYSELTIGRLQLAFIEKFSWNTQQNGVDLPEIYIQDPISGVRHELEDLSDIKDRTVLVLNIEPLDEVKRHIDEGLGSIKKMMQEVKQNVDDQGAALQRVSDRQQEAAKDMARIAAAPPPPMTPPADSPRNAAAAVSGRKLNPSHVSELHSLRRDLAVLRQTYSNFQSEVQGSMTALRNKANNVKVAAAKASVPDVDGDSGQAYVNSGRKQLNTDSDRLVTKVDDLQDLVEDLRKDVVMRGVRPLPRQLETVTKDITTLTKELKKMEDYMKREKPVWTKIWEKELEDVCQGRDELRLMEDLMVDLRDDLEKASETFALVEQATKEQMKDVGTGAAAAPARAFSKGLNRIGDNVGVDPSTAKEGVLGEVRALQPNHEDRLEAIERAEKLRQKELESRRVNPLMKELTDFVGEGKLKKSGGFEEVERARKAKDDRIRREVWERQNGIIPEDPVGEDAADQPQEEAAAPASE